MNIILLGAPGVGKGTQAKLIMERFKIPQVSTGDILRAEVKKDSPIGRKIKTIMENGELVSDDIILQIVENRLGEPDAQKGFILDGFPRTIPQADGLAELLRRLKISDPKVIEISLPDEIIIQRLTSRRVCSECGKVFNLLSDPPAPGNTCSNCGGEIFQRNDDREETIKNRLVIYRKDTEPLIGYYKKQKHFYRIDGKSSIREIFQDILKILNA